jgi:GAF domain-containing protein
MEADRSTYRKILGLAAAITIAIVVVCLHARQPNQLEASRRQLLQLAAPKDAQSITLAELN